MVNVAGSMPAQSGALTLFWDESGSEGPNSGGSAEGVDNGPGSAVWTDPTNALADDGAVARALSANIITDYLRIYNFGFSIPSGATITGIEVTIQASEQAGASTLENLQLIADNGGSRILIGTDKNPQQALTTTLTDYTFGGSSDLWGASLTPAIVNHSNFGFSVTAKNNAGVYTHIDYVSMTVYYSVRAGKLFGAFGPQSGDVTAIETIVLAGSMPEQTGALSLLAHIAVAGSVPAQVGEVGVRQLIALSGSMPAQSGLLSLLAHIAVSGSMPAQIGLLLSDLGVFVSGSMPEQSGVLSLLARIALAGSMPEQSGVLAIIAAKILAGEMPEFTGDVTIDRLLSHIALTGEMGDFLGTLVVPTSPGWMRPKGGGSLYIPRPKGGGSIYQPRPRGGFGFHQPRP